MRISERCYAITGFGFFPPWEVNAGFVCGDRTTLVTDTGPSALAAQTIHGYATVARPGNALIAVNLELHVDHLLGNCWFHDQGVPIWGHARCERGESALDENARELNELIPERARRDRFEAGVFFQGSRIVNPNRRLTAELELDLGGVAVRILPAPGHTPANLLVHVPSEGVLYTADTVVAGYLPNLTAGGPAEWEQWLDALAMVQQLAPAVVVPGHGPVLRGGAIEAEVVRIERILREAIG
jgi:glyoxylase-like metal-dependent hydrolase (beta-lactamase superfamily II)